MTSGEPMHLLDIALLAFCVFALLHPKSPFTLAMLRQRGPRRDYAVLLRSEIRQSSSGFASYALAAFIVAAAIYLAVRNDAPQPNAANVPLVVLVTCAGVGTWFAWQSVLAWLTAALRSDARDQA